MAGDPGMAYLNMLLDAQFEFEFNCAVLRYRNRREEAEAAPDLDPSDQSGQAQDLYESGLIAEARAIVAGTSTAQPSTEHLRILVGRLDSAAPVLIGTEIPF